MKKSEKKNIPVLVISSRKKDGFFFTIQLQNN